MLTVNQKNAKNWNIAVALSFDWSNGWGSNFQKMSKLVFLVFFCFSVKAILLWEHFFDFHVFFNIHPSESTQNSCFFEKVNQSTHTLGKRFPKSCYFCVKIRCFPCFSVFTSVCKISYFMKIPETPLQKASKITSKIVIFWKCLKTPPTINVSNHFKYYGFEWYVHFLNDTKNIRFSSFLMRLLVVNSKRCPKRSFFTVFEYDP